MICVQIDMPTQQYCNTVMLHMFCYYRDPNSYVRSNCLFHFLTKNHYVLKLAQAYCTVTVHTKIGGSQVAKSTINSAQREKCQM